VAPARRLRTEAAPSAWVEGLTLHVEDLQRSLEFYQRLPGFTLERQRLGQVAVLRAGDFLLGLLARPRITRPTFHLEVATTDLDRLHRQLRAVGIEPTGPPRQRPWGERTFQVTDPDGNQLEFQ
jgi:catechol 2,3-dioxygenase-like lactoylglutathione lyase family enzyme